LILLVLALAPARALAQTEVAVPLTVKGLFGSREVTLAATEYVPPGPGPFPAVVVNHGSPATADERVRMTARYAAASAVFLRWGFVVLNPLRRGYGKTGGAWDEAYGRCENPLFVDAGLESAKDIAAAVAYLRQHPKVDRDRIVLVGQSAGGWGVLALASRGDAPVRGVVNFAGGRAGRQKGIANNNCAPERLVDAARAFGKTASVPSLWIYTENDQYFAPELSRRMHAAYTEAGARAAFVMLPPFAADGHTLFGAKDGVPLWRDRVEAFFREVGVLAAR
jgi:dienelactone hydrolase